MNGDVYDDLIIVRGVMTVDGVVTNGVDGGNTAPKIVGVQVVVMGSLKVIVDHGVEHHQLEDEFLIRLLRCDHLMMNPHPKLLNQLDLVVMSLLTKKGSILKN